MNKVVLIENITNDFLYRKKLCEEFTKQIASVFTQWENDIAKTKENEEKLEVCVTNINELNRLIN